MSRTEEGATPRGRPRPAGEATPRERLLAGAIEHVSRHGVGEISLRGLAAALGTSHRMLLYHFGSRDGLVAAVSLAVEARQRQAFLAAWEQPARDPLEVAAAYWDDTVEAARRYGPLFFEAAAHATQGRPHAAEFARAMVADWLPAVTDIVRGLGVPETEAEDHARLALAASRGLLLDLLVTGQVEEVGRASRLLDRALAGLAARPS